MNQLFLALLFAPLAAAQCPGWAMSIGGILAGTQYSFSQTGPTGTGIPFSNFYITRTYWPACISLTGAGSTSSPTSLNASGTYGFAGIYPQCNPIFSAVNSGYATGIQYAQYGAVNEGWLGVCVATGIVSAQVNCPTSCQASLPPPTKPTTCGSVGTPPAWSCNLWCCDTFYGLWYCTEDGVCSNNYSKNSPFLVRPRRQSDVLAIQLGPPPGK